MKSLALFCCLLSFSLSTMANSPALNTDIDQQVKANKMNELKTLGHEISVLELKATSILNLVKELHSQKEKEFYISAVTDTALAAALIFPAFASFDLTVKNLRMKSPLLASIQAIWGGVNTYGIYKLSQNVYLNYKERQELAKLMDQLLQQVEELGIIQDNDEAKQQLHANLKAELALFKEQLSEDQKDGVKKKVAAGLLGAYGIYAMLPETKKPLVSGGRASISLIAVTTLAIARIIQVGDIKADFHLTQKQAQIYQRDFTKTIQQLRQIKQQIRKQERTLNQL